MSNPKRMTREEKSEQLIGVASLVGDLKFTLDHYSKEISEILESKNLPSQIHQLVDLRPKNKNPLVSKAINLFKLINDTQKYASKKDLNTACCCALELGIQIRRFLEISGGKNPEKLSKDALEYMQRNKDRKVSAKEMVEYLSGLETHNKKSIKYWNDSFPTRFSEMKKRWRKEGLI